MRYLSLFSGIEACSAAWKPLGWTCVAVAEIEPLPAAVLAHHYPGVPNLGDVMQITDAQIAALGSIDLVVGGSPCQDLSVAGKRAGLAGERSSLFHEQVRIFHAARTFCGARFLLWENVPGAFSSHGGRDFGIVVGSMAGCELGVPRGGWGTCGAAIGSHGLVEWRVLDAQYVRVESHPRAVPQRRRRVFALLDTGGWRDRPPILLEPEGLRGHPAPRREAGERPSPSIAPRARGGGGLGSDCAGGLVADTLGVGAKQTTGFESEVVAHSLSAEGFDASEDGTGRGIPLTVGALTDGAHMGGGSTARTPTRDESFRLPDVAWCLQERDAKGADSDTKPGHLIPVGGGFDDAIAFSCKDHGADAGEIAPTLRSMEFEGSHANGGGQVAVAFHNRQDHDVSGAVTHPLGAKDNGLGIWPQVRRLTPRECERLQGFPDDYTLVPVRGKPAADGPRYRALGNSMAVNCMRWIGERIDVAMASQWEAA